MRTKFSSELAALGDELTHMARLAHEAAERAAVAVENTDLTAAYEVLALDEQIQAEHARCEDRSVLLLALEAPVARDLRNVVTAIQIAEDLSGIAAGLSRVADAVVRKFPEPVAPEHITALLCGIGAAVIDLTAAAITAITVQQVEPDTTVIAPDTAMADLHQRLLGAVADTGWAHGSAVAVESALLAHHYERCAAHCVRIGRLIRFFHTGVPLSAQPDDE
ncbi:phosphate uptake regulator PhoU [Nocardia nova SH22a]|uniref:Phosphate uptake regulator PhoU n=1 Tax=Nocardia nova SH22a TaxID=1415166 RepID=W5TCM0_9NOCA|nr:PhoU domain-containing protein [Nocardia nova]AHH16997.1 phosphate uptake regulator PhoU [Nocardia nova SH22a]